ncbi:MAG: hypothetical protein AVDCRST_MAG77-501 [uncultured Chloroflexi bacterium]|uniref:HTH lacI-type domain-containing protein n=1 Tax=uncultured Chloroflexota bacterium TaxID=166587 RepID=A0A6J4HDV2_9CHLR|nr:MAG: hypothetical protein AVDCRST_MAG77-501 [uncultured Chloroflexota bacterium]
MRAEYSTKIFGKQCPVRDSGYSGEGGDGVAVTMRQIADEAGVSASTVSQVLNGRGGFSHAVAERVLAAARQLGYRHKNRARLGADRVLRRIGLVMAGNASIVARPFYASLLVGAGAECAAMDMTITYCPVSDPSGVARLGDAGVDGLVLAGYLAPELEAQLAALRLPAVVVNNRPSLPADRVVFDDAEGGRLAARVLLRHGHRRLAVLHDSLHRGVLHDRIAAFRAAVTDSDPHAEVETHEVPPNGDLPGSGYEVALAALGRPNKRGGGAARGGTHDSANGSAQGRRPHGQSELPTGVFCTSDRIALGALKALWDLGRPVPGSVSVVGFNDFEAAAHANPPLTTVRADMELMGRVAVRRLLERAREPEQPPMTVQIGVSLVERGSVGPAPGRPTKEGSDGDATPATKQLEDQDN